MRHNFIPLSVIAGFAALVLCACKSQAPRPETGKIQLPVIGSEVRTVPPAIVYQVSGGEETFDLVPITLTADGKSVSSFPDPSDLNAGQMPVALGDGWWLDRRGIGPNSVFTTYTYGQYEAMKQAPSVRELMGHIDRHVRITRMISLPISATEAASDPAVARAYIGSGFAGCIELLNRNE